MSDMNLNFALKMLEKGFYEVPDFKIFRGGMPPDPPRGTCPFGAGHGTHQKFGNYLGKMLDPPLQVV